MTNPKKELNVACNYFLRLIKNHVKLTNEQINLFKNVFHDILTKRFIDHWFPAIPHRGSAYRCLQTKHWKDPVLKSIAERSCLPLHRYLPTIFTMWIDPGEVAVCFGDEGTWCSLYKDDHDGQIHQEYSDGEETTSSLSSDDDLVQNVKNLDVNSHSISSKSLINDINLSPYFNAISSTVNNSKQSMNEFNSFSINWNEQNSQYFSSQYPSTSESLLFFNH